MSDMMSNGLFWGLDLLLTLILVPTVIRFSRRSKARTLRKAIYLSASDVLDALQDAVDHFLEILRDQARGRHRSSTRMGAEPAPAGPTSNMWLSLAQVTLGALPGFGGATTATEPKPVNAPSPADAESWGKVLSVKQALREFQCQIEFYSPHMDDAEMMLFLGSFSRAAARLFNVIETIFHLLSRGVDESPKRAMEAIYQEYAPLYEIVFGRRYENKEARALLQNLKSLSEINGTYVPSGERSDRAAPPTEDALGSCPRGHGKMRLWNGKPRCWTCGYPEK
jgi:hypothetical protein